MGRFKSTRQAQRFLSVYDQIATIFRPSAAAFSQHPTANLGLIRSACGTAMLLKCLPERNAGLCHVAT